MLRGSRSGRESCGRKRFLQKQHSKSQNPNKVYAPFVTARGRFGQYAQRRKVERQNMNGQRHRKKKGKKKPTHVIKFFEICF